MKQLWYKIFLVVIAISCVLLALSGSELSRNYLLVAVFPLYQIALLLRYLSLSNAIGNGIALLLYFAIASLPAMALLVIRKKRFLVQEDKILIAASIILLIVLYYMINPVLIPFSSAGNSLIYQAGMCGIVYSILLSYLLLRATRLLAAGNVDQLGQYLKLVLFFVQIYLVLLVFGVSFRSFLNEVHTLQAGNSGATQTLTLSYVFLAIKYFCNSLPDICNMRMIFLIFTLLEQWKNNRYSAETVHASKQLSQFCLRAITLIAVTQLSFNILQLVFQTAIRTISIVVYIPAASLLFLIVTLLINRFVIETKQLKDENDQFI